MEDMSYDSLIEQGKQFQAQGNFAKAIDFYQMANIQNEQADTYYQIGYCFIQIGELDSAKESLSASLERNAYYWQAHVQLIKVQFERGDYSEGVYNLKEAYEFHQESDLLDSLDLALYKETQDFNILLNQYNMILDFEPSKVIGLVNRIFVHIKLGNIEKAKKDINSLNVIVSKPNSVYKNQGASKNRLDNMFVEFRKYIQDNETVEPGRGNSHNIDYSKSNYVQQQQQEENKQDTSISNLQTENQSLQQEQESQSRKPQQNNQSFNNSNYGAQKNQDFIVNNTRQNQQNQQTEEEKPCCCLQ